MYVYIYVFTCIYIYIYSHSVFPNLWKINFKHKLQKKTIAGWFGMINRGILRQHASPSLLKGCWSQQVLEINPPKPGQILHLKMEVPPPLQKRRVRLGKPESCLEVHVFFFGDVCFCLKHASNAWDMFACMLFAASIHLLKRCPSTKTSWSLVAIWLAEMKFR